MAEVTQVGVTIQKENEAMKNAAEQAPGIRDILSIYQRFEQVQRAALPAMQIAGLQKISSVSDGAYIAFKR